MFQSIMNNNAGCFIIWNIEDGNKGQGSNINVENSPSTHHPHILDDQEVSNIFEIKFAPLLPLLMDDHATDKLSKGFRVL